MRSKAILSQATTYTLGLTLCFHLSQCMTNPFLKGKSIKRGKPKACAGCGLLIDTLACLHEIQLADTIS